MKSLTFDAGGDRGGGRIRSARFERRSMLATAAACMVASAVRESLGALWGRPANVRLLEPTIPSPQAWAQIVSDATLFRLRAEFADAAIVLRRHDAAALAAAAFGESLSPTAEGRELSPIECEMLDRTVARLAAALAPICGACERGGLERVRSIAGFVTYFELSIDAPPARIGIALSRDPAPERAGCLDLGDLAGVTLAPSVELALGQLSTQSAAALAVGSILPIPSKRALRGRLRVGGRTLGEGACGVIDGHYALIVKTGGGR